MKERREHILESMSASLVVGRVKLLWQNASDKADKILACLDADASFYNALIERLVCFYEERKHAIVRHKLVLCSRWNRYCTIRVIVILDDDVVAVVDTVCRSQQ